MTSGIVVFYGSGYYRVTLRPATRDRIKSIAEYSAAIFRVNIVSEKMRGGVVLATAGEPPALQGSGNDVKNVCARR
jgi:hypothetical protein